MWRTVVSVGTAVVLAGSGTLSAVAVADPAAPDGDQSQPAGANQASPKPNNPDPNNTASNNAAQGNAVQGNSGSDFYRPPSTLPPGKNGDVIRSEPSQLAFALPWINGQFPGKATRLMYRSEDTHGKPIATTGTYFDPTTPWLGPGPRPLVTVAPGTHGQGDQCSPSKLANVPFSASQPGGPMIAYEMSAADALLARGYAVVMPDYEGLGTPGVHTYVNRLSEAHTVLDAARAAQRLPDTQLPPKARVGLWGYSQGGGAAAAAAEQAGSYAPDLDVKGTYAGAPPADLRATLKQADGSSLAGVIGYTLNSMGAAYPQLRPEIQKNTNAAGKQMLNTVAGQCVGQTAIQYGFHHTSEYTASGEPLDRVLERIPAAQRALAENKIGNVKPSAPSLVVSGSADDIVPHGQAEQLAKDWQDKGASVDFQTIPEPPLEFLRSGLVHVVGDVPGLAAGMNWMEQRFAEPNSSATEH